MNAKTLWIIVAVIILAGLGWWWYSTTTQTPPPQAAEETGTVAGTEFADNSKDGAPAAPPVSAFTVRYTDQGFSPSSMTVPLGTTVTFVNQSSGEMWIASDEHPSHTSYDGSNKDTHCAAGYTGVKPLDECSTGTTFSFTFTKAGTWGFHNHRNDDAHGTIIVTN